MKKTIFVVELEEINLHVFAEDMKQLMIFFSNLIRDVEADVYMRL